MSPERTCSNCGAALPDDAPEGALCPACTQAAGAQTRIMRAVVVETIGDYEVVDKLGQGGMGAVYRARQLSLGRLVALKVLPNQFGEDPEFIGRFQREAKVAATLNHANLVRVYAAGQAEGCHYIAMELIEGENLHQRMRRERLPIPEALRICADVARGLQYGWDRAQLVHRDIKPSNVYLSHGGEVKVGDLGLAKSLTGNTTGLTQSGTMMGTPHYMSPEQIRGDKALDFRADVYSLGCTLYELLTGHPPYPGSDPISIARAHLDAPLPAIMRALPGCPMPLVRLVGRMLKKNPRERHGTYEDLIAEMDWVREQIEGGAALTVSAPRSAVPTASSPTPTPRTPTTAAPAKATPNVMLYAGIAAGVLILSSVVFFVMKPAKAKTKIAAVKPVEKSPALPSVPASNEIWVDALAEWWAKPSNVKNGYLAKEAAGSRVIDGVHAITCGTFRDIAIRATVSGHTAGDWRFQLRYQGDGGSTYKVELSKSGSGKIILHTRIEAKTLSTFQMPAGFSFAGRHTMEARVLGDKITCLVDGQEMGSVIDGAIREAGAVHFASDPGALIEKLEYRDLSASPAAATAATAPGAWIDALALLWVRWDKQGSQAVRREPEGTRIVDSTSAPKIGEFRDGAVRATVRGDTANEWRIYLRYRVVSGQPRNLYKASLFPDGRGELAVEQNGRSTALQKFRLAPGSTFAERHTMELRMQGDLLTCVLDGTEVARVRDSTFSERGGAYLHAGAGALIEKAEFLDLDASPTSPAPPVSASTVSGEWIDGLAEWWSSSPFASKGALSKEAGGSRRTDVPMSSIRIGEGRDLGRDVALRVTARGNPSGSWSMGLRGKGLNNYTVHLGNRNEIRVSVDGENRVLQTFTRPAGFDIAQSHTLEFRVEGNGLTAVLDGKEVASVTDDTLPDAGLAFVAVAPGALLEKIEYRDLSKTAKASASAASAPLAELWQDALRDPVKLEMSGKVERTPEGLRFTDNGGFLIRPAQNIPKRDGAIRMRAAFGGLQVALRARLTSGVGIYQLCARDATAITLDRWDPVSKQVIPLRQFPLRAPLQPGQDYELELRIVGQLLTATFNGTVLGTHTDATLQEGTFGVASLDTGAAPALVKALEVLNLDVPGRASTPAAGSEAQTFGGHRYQFVAEPMSWTEAKARAEALGGYLAAITSRAEYDWMVKTFRPHLDRGIDFSGLWLGGIAESREAGWKWVTGEPAKQMYWAPYQPDVGTHPDQGDYPAYLNLHRSGTTVGFNDNSDSAKPHRHWRGKNVGLLVEWDDAATALAGAPQGTPATATKEAPFVNSLGMKFTPVPIAGGPTDGKRVLFSVWETRVQDYEAFAKETRRPSKPDFEQSPTHPILFASWEDAKAFCAWLTTRERDAGQISPNESYRLPTDHEWSCAAGIGDREDATKTPEDKHARIEGVFPWGNMMPPPAGAGNFAGEELREIPQVGGNQISGVIGGYRDGYIATAPVGSFSVNRLGLYDLSGSVWEWCEDWSDTQAKERAMRGGSWLDRLPTGLLSSARLHKPPAIRGTLYGFRVVLAPTP